MSCCALKLNLKDCRNWSCLDSPFCLRHRDVSPEVNTERWFKRFILGTRGHPVFNYSWPCPSKGRILEDLSSARISLTKEDIQRIPLRDRYIDIFVLLCHHGYANPAEHLAHVAMCYEYFCKTKALADRMGAINAGPVAKEIEMTLIVPSYKSLIAFLVSIAEIVRDRPGYTDSVLRYIPTVLDSDAAKEMSWMSRPILDTLRVQYERKLGQDHSLTKCLVQRWLLDIKELYQTEKAIQKIKMDQCKEELMMNRWHPSRVEKYLLAGFDDDDM
jgi:hypothetical protein